MNNASCVLIGCLGFNRSFPITWNGGKYCLQRTRYPIFQAVSHEVSVASTLLAAENKIHRQREHTQGPHMPTKLYFCTQESEVLGMVTCQQALCFYFFPITWSWKYSHLLTKHTPQTQTMRGGFAKGSVCQCEI